MLYSFASALEQDIPEGAKKHIRAAQIFGGAEGFVLGPEALQEFLSNTHAGNDIPALIEHAQDDESRRRVDSQIRVRMVTDKIPDSVAQNIVEAVEVLGIHNDSMRSSEVPLVCVLYTSAQMNQAPIIINVTGKKSLADAVRELWARTMVSPYPPMDVKTAIVMYRMPPIEQCVHVILTDKTHLYAVHGWGLAVGDEEISDKYILGVDQSAFIAHEVRTQDISIYRNPRTGEVVRSRPSNPAHQKVTDDQLRRIASLARRAGVQAAYVGVFGEHLRVLRVSHEEVPSPSHFPLQDDATLDELVEPHDTEQEVSDEENTSPQSQEPPMAQEPEIVNAPDPSAEQPDPADSIIDEATIEHVVQKPADDVLEDIQEEEYDELIDEVHEHMDEESNPDLPPFEEEEQTTENNAHEEENHEENIIVEDREEETVPQQPVVHTQNDMFEQAVNEVEQSAQSAVREMEDAVEQLAQTLDQAEDNVEQQEEEYDELIDEVHEHMGEEHNPNLPPFEEEEQTIENNAHEEENHEENIIVEDGEEETEETADSVYNETIELAGHVIEYTLFTIELTLKEYLGQNAPADFADLVHAVANKREIPRMNRIIALHDMRVDGTSARPSPENVKLALDTLEAFRSEF